MSLTSLALTALIAASEPASSQESSRLSESTCDWSLPEGHTIPNIPILDETGKFQRAAGDCLKPNHVRIDIGQGREARPFMEYVNLYVDKDGLTREEKKCLKKTSPDLTKEAKDKLKEAMNFKGSTGEGSSFLIPFSGQPSETRLAEERNKKNGPQRKTGDLESASLAGNRDTYAHFNLVEFYDQGLSGPKTGEGIEIQELKDRAGTNREVRICLNENDQRAPEAHFFGVKSDENVGTVTFKQVECNAGGYHWTLNLIELVVSGTTKKYVDMGFPDGLDYRDLARNAYYTVRDGQKIKPDPYGFCSQIEEALRAHEKTTSQ